MIDLDPEQLAIIKRILKEVIPGVEVRGFGSRVNGTAGKFSDLDIAVVADPPLGFRRLEELRDRLSESDLPISVDVVDYHSVSDGFRRLIDKGWVEIQ